MAISGSPATQQLIGPDSPQLSGVNLEGDEADRPRPRARSGCELEVDCVAPLEGAGNHFDDQGLFEETPTSLYTKDGQYAHWKEGDYSTDFYTDQLIENIERHRADGKPFSNSLCCI